MVVKTDFKLAQQSDAQRNEWMHQIQAKQLAIYDTEHLIAWCNHRDLESGGHKIKMARALKDYAADWAARSAALQVSQQQIQAAMEAQQAKFTAQLQEAHRQHSKAENAWKTMTAAAAETAAAALKEHKMLAAAKLQQAERQLQAALRDHGGYESRAAAEVRDAQRQQLLAETQAAAAAANLEKCEAQAADQLWNAEYALQRLSIEHEWTLSQADQRLAVKDKQLAEQRQATRGALERATAPTLSGSAARSPVPTTPPAHETGKQRRSSCPSTAPRTAPSNVTSCKADTECTAARLASYVRRSLPRTLDPRLLDKATLRWALTPVLQQAMDAVMADTRKSRAPFSRKAAASTAAAKGKRMGAKAYIVWVAPRE